MKSKLNLLIACGLTAVSLIGSAQEAKSAASTDGMAAASGEVMPLITIEDAPLPDAIKTLARQANINYMADPKIFVVTLGPDQKPIPAPTVSFRWENITAMQALQAILDNNNLQLVPDPKNKVARITLKDAAALEPLISKVVHLRYANATNTLPVVQSVFGSARSKVIADARTSHLIVTATEKEMTQVDQIIQKLDTAPAQILIEAKFISTSKNPKTAKGVDWTSTLSAQHLSYGNTANNTKHIASPDTSLPLDQIVSPAITYSTTAGFGGVGYLNADGVNVVLSFLNTDGDAELISTPRAVALEGVDVELAVVQNVPIFEQEQAPSSGGITPPATIKPNYNLTVNGNILNEVGTKLVVTPRIFGDTNVFLSLKPEISDKDSVDESVTVNGKVTTSPKFNRRKIVTQSMVPSGSTLVLGGLTSDSKTKSGTKVPIFGDLPGIGGLFRSETKERDKKSLVIFVTPTILTTLDYQDGDQSREFMKTKHQEIGDDEWSEWDSTKHHDWSKPVY